MIENEKTPTRLASGGGWCSWNRDVWFVDDGLTHAEVTDEVLDEIEGVAGEKFFAGNWAEECLCLVGGGLVVGANE